jgi:hypothetical protein
MEITMLPPNDTFAQLERSLRILPEEEVQRRKSEMTNCNHLFVMLEKGSNTPGNHSSDWEYIPNTVECVHCGLTNKFMKLEEKFKEFFSTLEYERATLESKMFSELFSSYYNRGGKSFSESGIDLISYEVLPTHHPGLLYQIAMSINPNGTHKEIFDIMTELHFFYETEQERLRLQTFDQTEQLRIRYNNFKVLVKGKNNGGKKQVLK